MMMMMMNGCREWMEKAPFFVLSIFPHSLLFHSIFSSFFFVLFCCCCMCCFSTICLSTQTTKHEKNCLTRDGKVKILSRWINLKVIHHTQFFVWWFTVIFSTLFYIFHSKTKLSRFLLLKVHFMDLLIIIIRFSHIFFSLILYFFTLWHGVYVR